MKSGFFPESGHIQKLPPYIFYYHPLPCSGEKIKLAQTSAVSPAGKWFIVVSES